MSLLSWQRRLIPSAMSSKWRAPHLNERLEDIYSLSSHSHGIQKIPGKTFKMLKRLVFSRGNVNFGICLIFALAPISRLLVWSLKVPRAGSKTSLSSFLVISEVLYTRTLTKLMQKNNLESVSQLFKYVTVSFLDISSTFSSTRW